MICYNMSDSVKECPCVLFESVCVWVGGCTCIWRVCLYCELKVSSHVTKT